MPSVWFWSSGILTGNQTGHYVYDGMKVFWSSGILTGNQTEIAVTDRAACFGAVAF